MAIEGVLRKRLDDQFWQTNAVNPGILWESPHPLSIVGVIQAITAQTPRGSFHGTQYHPEHTLTVSAALMEMRAAELVDEGFGTEPAEIVAIAADYRTLDAEPTRRDLVWRYGIASEIMDPVSRTTEIGNRLRAVIVPGRF